MRWTLEDRIPDGPDEPVSIDPPATGLPGQTGIRFREALARGDARVAASLALALDEAHLVELLLGEALRDARGAHAAAALWMAAEREGGGPERWWPVCRLLCEGAPDRRLDELAAGYVAERRVPEGWSPGGRPLGADVRGAAFPDVAVAAALGAGVGGDALLECFADLPLHAAVARYYRVGMIHALGPRPLLILAASAAR